MKAGARVPNFTLNYAMGEPVDLYDYLKKDRVILT
jgi:peroxiredoxin